MGSQFPWQLSFALVLPLVIPVLGTLLVTTILATRNLKRERAKFTALYNATQGRRIR